MKRPELHRVEILVLRTLRRSTSARFSELMKPTELKSDAFKFYVRRLRELGYISKDEDGNYSLTAVGKEFANNLDEDIAMIQKQPKVSILIIIPKPKDKTRFLFQRRLRQPYYDFYGQLSGPVKWGEEIEVTAARELTKQTGLVGDCKVIGFYRQKDFDNTAELLLEDKLFSIVEAIVKDEVLENSWSGGYNEWMTLEEYMQKEKRFPATERVLAMRATNQTYASEMASYAPEEY
ncbi:MAG TPA: NUDIX domain-containing protein [Candidatus Saccharimonadales bacterium]|nr:NUDIX domain-containing protein [Candidatus Saccharimonadales bacterium]